MMKLFRRLELGVNPDYEIGRFLTEDSQFDRIPKAAGAIEYQQPGSEPMTLAFPSATRSASGRRLDSCAP